MTQRLRILTALCACLAASCASAVPKTDMAGLPICSDTGSNIPAGFKATQGYNCDRMSPMENCTFTLKGDGHKIRYLVQDGIIVTKTYWLHTKKTGPFALILSDNVKSSKAKLQKATGLEIEIFEDPQLYLQSSDIDCGNNSYSINVYFNKQKRAQKVIVSTLPVV